MADIEDIKLEIEKIKIWKNGNGAKGAEKRIQENEIMSKKAFECGAASGMKAEKANERIDDHMNWHKGQTRRMNWLVGVVAIQLIGWLLRDVLFPNIHIGG